jgi:hypothetical protein
MPEQDIKAAFLVLQGAVSMALPDLRAGRAGDYEKEKKQRELVEAAIGASFQIVENAFIDLHRIADALEAIAQNGVGVHGGPINIVQ